MKIMPTPGKAYYIRSGIFGLLILFIVIAGMSWFAIDSGFFEEGEQFTSGNAEIKQAVGIILKIKPRYLDGLQYELVGGDGDAEFIQDVVGNKSSAIVHLTLVSKNYGWKIVTAKMESSGRFTDLVIGKDK